MKTIILGLDAFDPVRFEWMSNQGVLPNLSKYLDVNGYSRFQISNPAQSEVSWTSIATGLNPGAHGIFDFVHRDPNTYTPYVSLLPTKSGLGGTQFVRPTNARTIFELAVRKGYPATSLWWPATFPARLDIPVDTIPGLGAPDIHGQLGVGTLYTTDNELTNEMRKTKVECLAKQRTGVFSGVFRGPMRKSKKGNEQPVVDFKLEIQDEEHVKIIFDNKSYDLITGKWSDVIAVVFRMGMLYKGYAITRILLRETSPDLTLYCLPLQIHPLHSPWPYATSKQFIKSVWNSYGPFLTVGWPQDTTGLEENCMTDDQFLDLCSSIFEVRRRIFLNQVRNFREGILAGVFDSLDRVQHMFWRDRPDIIDEWYQKLDNLVGEVLSEIPNRNTTNTRFIVVSDHGFSRFDYKVHLNRWLINNGYMAIDKDMESGKIRDIIWEKTKAYAIGLNSIYLNIDGRESKGTVKPDQIESLVEKLRQELIAWKTSDGSSIVKDVWLRNEVLDGTQKKYGPDLLIGYSPGYRASAETGLGGWECNAIELNLDHWNADHCIAPDEVPGVIFTNKDLENYLNPSYKDFPLIAIGEEVSQDGTIPPLEHKITENDEILEERLRSLGYL